MAPRLILLALIGMPLYWAFWRPRRWRGQFTISGRVVFPSSGAWQTAGVFVAFVLSVALLAFAFTQRHAEPQIYFLLAVFIFAGVSVLFRRVELDSEGVALKSLLSTKQMSWAEMQSAHRVSDGSWLLVGGSRRLKLDRHYCDFELLVLEITRQLESRYLESHRLSYDDSCRKLQRMGLLAEGTLPSFPDRLPQSDDPENYGMQFFRAMLDPTADLSNLCLARCFIARSELNGARFANSDLSQSNLCWNDFTCVDFTNAVLVGADMRSSHFIEVRFARADLRGADLRHSTFQRCIFEGALFESAILTRDQGTALDLSDQQRLQIDWRDQPGPEPPGG